MLSEHSKSVYETHYSILGCKPFLNFSKIDLNQLSSFLKSVKEKIYTSNDLKLIENSYLPVGIALDDFLIQELNINKEKNQIISESHRQIFSQKTPLVSIPVGIIEDEYVDKEVLESYFQVLTQNCIVPSIESMFFTGDTWSELSNQFIQNDISLARHFIWWEAETRVFEQIQTCELQIVLYSLSKPDY